MHVLCVLFEKSIWCKHDFFKKILSCVPILLLFISFTQWWLRLSSNKHKAVLIHLKIRAFYFPFAFCLGHSHLKTSGPNQTSYHHRNTPLLIEKMAYITKLQITTEPIHVIKWLDKYLTCHTSKKINENVDQLFEMNHLFSFFLHLTFAHSNVHLPLAPFKFSW